MPMTANGLAKLLEELGELSQVAAKKLAYFHTDEHPDGAGSKKWATCAARFCSLRISLGSTEP